MLRIRNFGVGLVVAALAAVPAALQEPKPGSAWYEDKVDLGFKVKAPKDWEFVPGSPLETNLIGKYADPGEGKYVNLGKEAFILCEVRLVKFDRREQGGKKLEREIDGKSVELTLRGLTDVESYMSKALDEGKDWREVEKPVPFKGAMPGATFAIYEGLSARGRQDGTATAQPVRAFVANYPLGPELDVAFIGLGPGGKKWGSFEKAYAALAKTLQPVTVEALARDPVGRDPRSQKRAKLQEEIARTPGWSLHETHNYFIVSSYSDKQFIEELKQRLEGMRLVYEADYPPSKARKIEKGKPADPSSAEGTKPADDARTVSAVDALELGRCSVVRVCKDRAEYLQYGAPPSSAGYFSSIEEELVIYDDREDRGRDYTWGVLSHEGLHQYVFAFFGNIAPHSWYNEGNGDFYFGFEFKNGKFKLGPARGRLEAIKMMISEDRHVPLQNFVRWTQQEYYGSNKGNGKQDGPVSQGDCYAQGWALVWFLRTGAGKAKGWQKEWGSILDTYLAVLLDTGDLDQAVTKAFEGVNWAALEASWLAYIRP
jgi:hypothetical protein